MVLFVAKVGLFASSFFSTWLLWVPELFHSHLYIWLGSSFMRLIHCPGCCHRLHKDRTRMRTGELTLSFRDAVCVKGLTRRGSLCMM